MNDCEHNWRLYEDESVRCMICDDILDHPKELAEELMGIFEDLGTMHGLKEQYRSRAEKAEARVKELEKVIRLMAGTISTMPEWSSRHPKDVLDNYFKYAKEKDA